MKVEFDFTLEEVIASIRRAEEEVRALALKVAWTERDLAFVFAPEKTGRLKESIRVIESDKEIIVEVTAPCRETREMATGFFRRAIAETEQRIPEWLRQMEMGG